MTASGAVLRAGEDLDWDRGMRNASIALSWLGSSVLADIILNQCTGPALGIRERRARGKDTKGSPFVGARQLNHYARERERRA
ncbi:hypothetical protein K523DRAFT_124698 [Schizophyllum commune Tattone D]|nr:hypothetical protein K523DRAFT_124698 [Schizophyllum commune Tattone D]